MINLTSTSNFIGTYMPLCHIMTKALKPCLRGCPPPLGFLQAVPPRLYHTKLLLPRCCPSYRGMNAVATRGCCSGTFPSPRPSAWCAKSTDVVGVHDVESRMKSVLLATNSQVVSGRSPEQFFGFIQDIWGGGRLSLYRPQGLPCGRVSIGQPAVMSGQAMAMRRVLLQIQPLKNKLFSFVSIIMLNAGWWGVNGDDGIPPSRRLPLIF
jgi:hypothetical protein